MSTVNIWRNSFYQPGIDPTFSGGWKLGDDWRNKSWASPHTIIERRTVPLGIIFSMSFNNEDVEIMAHAMRTLKSRAKSKFFYAATGRPYDGPVVYKEKLDDE